MAERCLVLWRHNENYVWYIVAGNNNANYILYVQEKTMGGIPFLCDITMGIVKFGRATWTVPCHIQLSFINVLQILLKCMQCKYLCRHTKDICIYCLCVKKIKSSCAIPVINNKKYHLPCNSTVPYCIKQIYADQLESVD